MRLAATLRRLMKDSRLTSKKLAEEVNLPEGTLKTWLAGSAPRSLADVRRVARHFGVSFEYLVFGDEFLEQGGDQTGKSGPVEIYLKLTIEPSELKTDFVSEEKIQGIRIKGLRG
jgi:transcriptional regulator with XRE-family HTH domain